MTLSLENALKEYQKSKNFEIADGSLTFETFQALGEEMNEQQLNSIVFSNPALKTLFATGKHAKYKHALKAEEIIVKLNVVYNESDFTETSAKAFLKIPIQDAKSCYKEIAIGFTESFRPGTVTNERDDYGIPKRIDRGVVNDAVNIYIYFNGKDHKDWAKTQFPSRHVMAWRTEFTKTNYLRAGTLTHELTHVFGLTGLTSSESLNRFLIWSGLINIRGEYPSYVAEAAMRSRILRYGVDWVDDVRNSYENVVVPGGGVFQRKRTPTNYDVLRYGARLIRDRTKKE